MGRAFYHKLKITNYKSLGLVQSSYETIGPVDNPTYLP
jgi:hypothetical protein